MILRSNGRILGCDGIKRSNRILPKETREEARAGCVRGAKPRLGQVAEQEFGLEDAAQVAVGAVEVILGGAREEALQGYRRSRVPAFQ